MNVEVCDVCGSTNVKEINCKVICQNCGTILRSCADLLHSMKINSVFFGEG
jgi:Zinc-finger of RNA-polymerase I-specific TFIIB, Rrn7